MDRGDGPAPPRRSQPAGRPHASHVLRLMTPPPGSSSRYETRTERTRRQARVKTTSLLLILNNHTLSVCFIYAAINVSVV